MAVGFISLERSYGAITGTTVVAQEKRIRAAALVVGGGNFRLLARAPWVGNPCPDGCNLWPVFMTALAGPGDPIRYAALTAGTPVLMLNGTNDRVVTPEAGEALFAALGEPKEIAGILWITRTRRRTARKSSGCSKKA